MSAVEIISIIGSIGSLFGVLVVGIIQVITALQANVSRLAVRESIAEVKNKVDLVEKHTDGMHSEIIAANKKVAEQAADKAMVKADERVNEAHAAGVLVGANK